MSLPKKYDTIYKIEELLGKHPSAEERELLIEIKKDVIEMQKILDSAWENNMGRDL
jgi:hypothetical protein